MNEGNRYLKVVAWSEEDQCFIGTAPGLFHGGCHGPDERKVFEELLGIVDEWIAIHKKNGDPLPPSTAGRIDDFLSGARTAAE